LLRDGKTGAEVRRNRRLQWKWQGFSRHTILIVTGVAFTRPPSEDPLAPVITANGFTVKTVAC
jgi:hypothetical protein